MDNAFLRLLGGYRSDYEPAASVTELAAQSEVVALGRLREVREGRVFGTARTDPERSENLLLIFDLEKRYRDELDGALAGRVAYVEVPKPGLEPAATFDAAAPKGARALLYLQSVNVLPPGTPVVAPATPLPAKAPLLWFTTPQGFLLDLNGGVTTPLDFRGSGRPVFPAGDPGSADLRDWAPEAAGR